LLPQEKELIRIKECCRHPKCNISRVQWTDEKDSWRSMLLYLQGWIWLSNQQQQSKKS